MIPGQTSLGSTKQPDNQADHHGSYSWTWWCAPAAPPFPRQSQRLTDCRCRRVNGRTESGALFRPQAPPDLFGAFGDGRYGPSTMSVLPSEQLVVSWNHAQWNHWNVSKENEALGLLMAAVKGR